MQKESDTVTPERVTELIGEGRRAIEDAESTVRYVVDNRDSFQEFVGAALTRLQRSSQAIADVVSAFPETKKFLEARGVTHTHELDQQGRCDLKAHLKLVLAQLEAQKEDERREKERGQEKR